MARALQYTIGAETFRCPICYGMFGEKGNPKVRGSQFGGLTAADHCCVTIRQTEVVVKVILPDSLKSFVERQVSSGRYANPDAFIAELLRNEAEMFARVSRGEPFPVDEHFDRRLEALLDEGEVSGDYVPATKKEFDAMEREALELVRKRKSS